MPKWNAVVVVAVLPLLAACATPAADGPSARASSVEAPTLQVVTPSVTTDPVASPTPSEEKPMSEGTPFRVIIGETVLEGTLGDTSTARDLASLLPLTVEFRDLNDVEKIAALPRTLTMEGVPAGADPEPQDIGYYEPTGDLVLYYGDVGYWTGIVRLGVFETDLAVLEGLTGPFTATVQLAE